MFDAKSGSPVDSRTGKRLNSGHGDPAISPRGVKPKYRVPFFTRGRNRHVILTTISPDKLARLIGTANMPVLIDVRTDEDFATDPRLIQAPSGVATRTPPAGSEEFSGPHSHCRLPARRQVGARYAAWLRHLDVSAETLDGGFEGWKAANLPLAGRKTPATRRTRPHRLGDKGGSRRSTASPAPG